MPAGWNTFRSGPPHTPHVVSASSVIRWKTSTCCPHDVHSYSYVGMDKVYPSIAVPPPGDRRTDQGYAPRPSRVRWPR